MEFDEFTQSYVDSALSDFGASDEWPYQVPPETYKLHEYALARMANDCKAFQFAASEYIKGREHAAGYDFWLTRNGHGAGFWDGDWPQPAAEILTVASKACGEFGLYMGDDGKIHCM